MNKSNGPFVRHVGPPLVVGHWLGSPVIHGMRNGATYCDGVLPFEWVFTADYLPGLITCPDCRRHPRVNEVKDQ